MKAFEPYEIKNLKLKNRIVLPPMCMYVAESDGKANEKHYVHYISRAIGGTGLIILEATAISSEGRLSNKDLGLWCDEQIAGLQKIVNGCHENGSKISIQINHGGRKGFRDENGILYAPSVIAFNDSYGDPVELTKEHIDILIEKYRSSAKRAVEAGFDSIEIHGAHGYLVHEFLSPLTNLRKDEFGGTTENRVRFLKYVISAMRSVMPNTMPLLLRISASDYTEGGIDIKEMICIINMIKKDIDIVHVSSGGLLNKSVNTFPCYQVDFAKQIKEACDIPTISVGLITKLEEVEEILSNESSDLVALGRELLRNPYWVMNNADEKYIQNNSPVYYNPEVIKRMKI